MAHAPHVTCEVEYVADRGMWVVTVYVDGAWNMEQWFHSRSAAEFWAQRKQIN